MSKFEQSEDAKYIKEGIHAYWEDKKRAGTMNTPETIKNLQIFLPKHTKVI